jgi:protein-tyrosine-phosphatase
MNVERTTDLARRASVHAALADVTRLQIVDRLSFSDASASELGSALDVPSNLLAHHLKVLETTGLIIRRRSEGDGRRSYLTLAPDAPLPWLDAWPLSTAPSSRLRRVLFVCTANTARSHLAAALWRRASPIRAASAGTHPGEHINPSAVAVAQRHGLVVPEVAPRSLERTQREGDLIVTVCDRAHEELNGADWAHWSIPDPVLEGRRTAYERAFAELASRVTALATRLQVAS